MESVNVHVRHYIHISVDIAGCTRESENRKVVLFLFCSHHFLLCFARNSFCFAWCLRWFVGPTIYRIILISSRHMKCMSHPKNKFILFSSCVMVATCIHDILIRKKKLQCTLANWYRRFNTWYVRSFCSNLWCVLSYFSSIPLNYNPLLYNWKTTKPPTMLAWTWYRSPWL